MKEKQEFPETLSEAIKYFADTDTSINFMAAIRWPDGKVSCPRCQSYNMVYTTARRLSVWTSGCPLSG